jgi:hypothetical protein
MDITAVFSRKLLTPDLNLTGNPRSEVLLDLILVVSGRPLIIIKQQETKTLMLTHRVLDYPGVLIAGNQAIIEMSAGGEQDRV